MSTGSWLRAHRKKIITHAAIIGGFVLFTIFVAEPLFDRLERIPGEAQLHRLQLPAETTNMRCEIDYILAKGHSGVEIRGWAYVDGQDSQNRELYIVLKSAQRTYVFDTRVELRPDLLKIREVYGEELVSNADYSGFGTFIPARKINNGEYIVGFYNRFYLRNRVIEALYYTDRVVIKSQDSVTPALLTSKLVEVTLPEEPGNMQFGVAGINERKDGEQEFVEIRGWAFIEGHSTKDGKTYVVLKSDINTYVFDTIPKYAWWVGCQFGNCLDPDLDYSGFIARIPKDQLEDGTYQLGIYIAKGDIEAFRYTDSVVIKS
jgi:hypothetical protein